MGCRRASMVVCLFSRICCRSFSILASVSCIPSILLYIDVWRISVCSWCSHMFNADRCSSCVCPCRAYVWFWRVSIRVEAVSLYLDNVDIVFVCLSNFVWWCSMSSWICDISIMGFIWRVWSTLALIDCSIVGCTCLAYMLRYFFMLLIFVFTSAVQVWQFYMTASRSCFILFKDFAVTSVIKLMFLVTMLPITIRACCSVFLMVSCSLGLNFVVGVYDILSSILHSVCCSKSNNDFVNPFNSCSWSVWIMVMAVWCSSYVVWSVIILCSGFVWNFVWVCLYCWSYLQNGSLSEVFSLLPVFVLLLVQMASIFIVGRLMVVC